MQSDKPEMLGKKSSAGYNSSWFCQEKKTMQHLQQLKMSYVPYRHQKPPCCGPRLEHRSLFLYNHVERERRLRFAFSLSCIMWIFQRSVSNYKLLYCNKSNAPSASSPICMQLNHTLVHRFSKKWAECHHVIRIHSNLGCQRLPSWTRTKQTSFSLGLQTILTQLALQFGLCNHIDNRTLKVYFPPSSCLNWTNKSSHLTTQAFSIQDPLQNENHPEFRPFLSLSLSDGNLLT